MLQFFRNNTKVLAWFFVSVLVVAFVLTSVTYSKHEQYAGEVFGKKISFQEFRTFETMTRLFAPAKEILEDARMANQFTWQQIMLSREAKNQNFQVADTEVKGQIDQLLNPESKNQISADDYARLLKSWRTTSYEFENGIREQIRIRKMVMAKIMLPPSPKEAPADAAAAKILADQMNADQQKARDEYVKWMGDIYERAKIIDYSQQSNLPAGQPAGSNSPTP